MADAPRSQIQREPTTGKCAPLEYASGETLRRAIWRPTANLLLLMALGGATFLTLLPDLHNMNPFYPLWGCVALVTTAILWLDWSSRRRVPARGGPGRWVMVTWMILMFLGFVGAYHRYFDEDPHVTARRITYCSGHLQQVGQLLEMYAREHGGKYPDSLSDVLERYQHEIEMQIFDCPGVVGSFQSSPTTQEVRERLSAGKSHYVYLGKGLTLNSSPTTVLAHDRIENHAPFGGGMSVLYADGSTEFLDKGPALQLLKKLQAEKRNSGENPSK